MTWTGRRRGRTWSLKDGRWIRGRRPTAAIKAQISARRILRVQNFARQNLRGGGRATRPEGWTPRACRWLRKAWARRRAPESRRRPQTASYEQISARQNSARQNSVCAEFCLGRPAMFFAEETEGALARVVESRSQRPGLQQARLQQVCEEGAGRCGWKGRWCSVEKKEEERRRRRGLRDRPHILVTKLRRKLVSVSNSLTISIEYKGFPFISQGAPPKNNLHRPRCQLIRAPILARDLRIKIGAGSRVPNPVQGELQHGSYNYYIYDRK